MTESSAARTRPNILWIIADPLRADHVGFGGNAIVPSAHGVIFNDRPLPIGAALQAAAVV